MGDQVTRLDDAAPILHRFAHHYSLQGWGGGQLVWRVVKRLKPIASPGVWVGGARVTLNEKVWLDRAIYFGLYETEELKLVARLVHEGDVCVDIGANLGIFTAICATRSRSGKVLAFEPSPTFERLQENVRGLANVTIEQVALSNTAEQLVLGGGGVDDVRASFREGHASTGLLVRTIRLDEAIGENTEIDFLKLDVEGWESNVIDGAGRLWRERRIGIALIEANPQWGSIEYLDEAEQLGYVCFELREVGRVRRKLTLQPLNSSSLKDQRNVLVVRPDRLVRLPGGTR